MSKEKFLNLLILISSLFVYLEWSGDNAKFLFQIELDLFQKLPTDPGSVIHPFILLPILGQSILLITLFQKEPSKKLTYIGIIGLAVLVIFIALIGIMSKNVQITISTLPFFGFAIWRWRIKT
jgi:hypothetical protein